MHSVASGSEDTRSVSPVDVIVVFALWFLQITLAFRTVSTVLSAALAVATGLFVVSLLLVGHATGRLRSVPFFTVLFAGWTVLATVRYAVTRSTGDALLAVLTAAFLAYYLVRRRTRDQSLASSAGR